jgi:lactate permease
MVYGLRTLGLAKVKQLFGQAIRRVGEPFVVIMSMSVAISVMTNTGREGLPSMIMVLSSLVGKDWLEVLTPLAGALGSMLTGSITISSLLFGKVFQETASLAGVDVGKVLGLLISGAAIGNSVAVADIMASEAVLGLKNKTREVIRGTAVGVIGALGVMMVLAAVLFN